MAGLAMPIPRGALVIDLGKSRRHRDKPGLSLRAYNASLMGQKHPKGADGRFVDGHPSVGMLGDLPDFVGSLSDADLGRADAHANSLIQALTAEKGRRGIAAMAAAQKVKPLKATRPAKPLRAKAPTKPIPQELKDKLAEIKKRPIPGDRAFLERELKGLTVAQLASLDPDPLPGRTKAEKVEDVIRRHTGMLEHEAITHGTHDGAFDGEVERAKKRAFQDEFKRRKKLAAERGDREEYAALVAGFGIAGTGPGLPPEKVPPKQDFSVASDPWGDTAARKAQLDQTLRTSGNPAELEAAAREWGELTGGERHMWIDGYRGDYARMAADNRGTNRKANAGAVADRIGELGSEDEIVAALSGKGAAELRRVGAELGIRFPSGMKDPDALRAHIGRSMIAYGSGEAKLNPAKPLRASGSKHIDNPSEPGESAITKPAAKGAGRISAKDLPAAMAEIDALAANPKTERDRDRVKNLLGRMTLAQIQQVADKHHGGLLVGSNKDEKVKRLADSIVGTKLDSAGIASGIKSGQHATRVAALRAATDRETARGWLTGLSGSDLKAVAKELGMRGAPSTKKELTEAIVEFTGGNQANSRAIRGGVTKPGEPSAFEIGGATGAFRGADNGPTYLDTPRQIEGDGNFFKGRFHPDGTIGEVWQSLSAKQASENIGGKRLDDVLGETVRMGYSGEPGIAAKQLDRLRTVAEQTKDPAVRERIQRAIDELEFPAQLDALDRDALPPALRALAERLENIPGGSQTRNAWQGGTSKELEQLADFARRWQAGEVRDLDMEVRRLGGYRHESQEGFHEVQRAVAEAADRLRKERPMNPARRKLEGR